MVKTVSAIGLGIVAGTAIAATAFLASARLPGAGMPESSTAVTFPPGPMADLVRLAGRDGDAALAELARIDDPRLRRDTALALLEEFGTDLEGIARIAAALASADGLNFTFDAIALAAARDPDAAIAMALALENPSAQTEAITRIAMALVAVDPRAALGHAAAIANYRLADSFRTAVLEEWASLDPDGFFYFLETAGPRDIPPRSDAFRIAASTDPDRLLTLLDRLPPNLRSAAELAGLAALVRIDPAAAFARIDAMPGSSARSRALAEVARSLATHDPAAALAWLEARQSAGPAEISAVLNVLAETDPLRAVDMLIANVARMGNATAFYGAIDGFAPGQRQELMLVADRLSATNDAAIQIAFGMFMDQWAQNDPEAAVDWAFANADRLNPRAIEGLATALANENAELAKQAAARLPLDLQEGWIRIVAGQLAQVDIEGTLQWLAGNQGQPYYEGAVYTALMQHVAGVRGGGGDPRSIAAFVERQSPQLRANSAPLVGYLWAGTDPRAAAQWAERVDFDSANENRRLGLFANVAGQWAMSDPDGARDWVLGMPPGEGRDQVLGALLRTTVDTGRIDMSAVDSYSSDERRQQSLLGMMPALGARNPELGRSLIERYFDDPEASAQAEQRLIDGAANPFATGGNVIY